MAEAGETAEDESESVRGGEGPPEPGLAAIFVGGRPTLEVRRFGPSGSLVVGRQADEGFTLPDDRLSREHVSVRRDGERWVIEDLGSRNGTFLDGARVERKSTTPTGRVLRLGQSIVLLEQDVRRFARPHRLDDPSFVQGTAMRAVHDAIVRVARSGDHLLVVGESGTGKEQAARTFHAHSAGAKGPFVDVNCAAIPEPLAERLLFGAKKGAFSGATADSVGYVQASHGGVLFLDEVGELDLAVQAKLLRVLETREVMPLGASTPRAIDLRVCAATNRDLRAAISLGKFRADLYYRLAQDSLTLPPLRDRPEEIPFIAALAMARVAGSTKTLRASARFLEACLLRPWPGNVRELLTEVRRAAQTTHAGGASTVGVESLHPLAGTELGEPPQAPSIAPPVVSSTADRTMHDAIVAAMVEHDGNVAAVARTLGLHRTQLYRLMKKLGVEVA